MRVRSRRRLPAIAERLDAGGAKELAEAILTTDRGPKSVSLRVELSAGTVTLSAQAKGAGMIQPSFATMLCFVETDAKLSSETASLLLGATVRRSFERISVDGQLSTNDAVLLMASGASGVAVEPESGDELRLGEALDCLLRSLALQIVADGEGAARVARLVVEGGDDEMVEHVARTVASSPLGQGSPPRRRPQLGSDPRSGGDGTPRQSAPSGRHRDRGRRGLQRGRGCAS